MNKSWSLWIGVWTLEAHKLEPIRTDLAAAPDNVLQVTRYSCKGSNSASRAYSCRKLGLRAFPRAEIALKINVRTEKLCA